MSRCPASASRSRSIRKRDATVPPHVAAVIDRALSEPPLAGAENAMRQTLASSRYADGAAFREALAQALALDGF